MNDKVNYRMCACCRCMKHKHEMARITVKDGKSIIDKTFKAGGRGFYVCSKECLDKIMTSKKYARYSGMLSDESIIKELKEVLDDANKS